MSYIPVNTSRASDTKTIESDCVNGKLRASKLIWKSVGVSPNEWRIVINIYPIKTAIENLADSDMSKHMNDDFEVGHRPPSLVNTSSDLKSRMDSRNDQFTSTLRVLNRVLDTASAGL